VLGALADTSGELLPSGEVLFTRNVCLYVGELGGGDSARARRLAQVLDSAGVRAAATPEIRTLEWSKFCGWVGLMALSVTTRAHTWRFLSDPDAALLVTRLVRETGALARALGIGLSDSAVLPAATLCAAAESDAVALVMRIGDEYRRNVPTHRMSALQDVEAGRPLEVHETLGYACEKARELELDLPLLAAFTRLIAAIDRMR
jgi:2-dehydropantoate 2-reductase